MTNSSRKKKITTVTSKKLKPPQLEVIETILRELLLEYNSQEVKRLWHMIRHESQATLWLGKEVNEFKEHLYELFEEARSFRWWHYGDEVYYPDDELLRQCFSLFFEYLNINNYRAFIIWLDTVKDKETLSKLYILFYSEMINLNLEIRDKFQPVEFGVLMKKRKLLARGMDREAYATISKKAAPGALDVIPDDLHVKEIQGTFYKYKLDNASRQIVQFLRDLRENIYYSQASKSEP